MVDGEFERTKGKVHYEVTDLDHPMRHPIIFHTNRNKGDGHDDYWKNRRTGVQKVTTLVEVIFDNKKDK